MVHHEASPLKAPQLGRFGDITSHLAPTSKSALDGAGQSTKYVKDPYDHGNKILSVSVFAQITDYFMKYRYTTCPT